MRKNNKNFVIWMISTAVIGLIILMTMMLWGVKHFVGQNSSAMAMSEARLKPDGKNLEVEYSATILAVVTDLTDSEIQAINIENNQSVVKPIDRTTKVADAYNRTIPLSSIKKGDIVAIVYQEDKARTLSISKSSEAWTKSRVSGMKVNASASEVELFGSVYTYDANAFVLSDSGVEGEMELVTPCDIVSVQGIKDKVLSVCVEKAAGSIEITDIPSRQGRVEIDINTMIPLEEVTAPIKVVPGKHKVVVSMSGYENMIEEIQVAPGEVYELSLDSVKRAYTSVSVTVSNVEIEDYNTKIGNTTYAKGEAISVPQGTYHIAIMAKGYKPWMKTISFGKDHYNIKATLESEKTEAPVTPTPSETVKEEVNNTEATSETKTIDIATDPDGAKVYINGVNKGTTPYKVTLPIGSYSVLLEKDGYEVYSTSIILDGSDDQTGFLYVLTPNN